MQPEKNDQDVIREAAYYKWLAAGAPAGDGFEFWLESEREYRLLWSEELPTTELAAAAAHARDNDRRSSSRPAIRPDKELLIGSRG